MTTIDKDKAILALESEIADLKEKVRAKRSELNALRYGKNAPARMHLVVYIFANRVDLYLVFGKVDPYRYTRGEGTALVFDLRTWDGSFEFLNAWTSGKLESDMREFHIEGTWKKNDN